jgi:coatomer protein complex subunit gamma
MSTHSYKKNEDGDASVLPDKMTVYQECLQACNASPIQAKKCRRLLSRLLRLFYAGETFPVTESTNLFFSISKLFHNDDPSLRQIAYLSIKELCSVSNDILMITASIMKDIQSGNAVYKPDAVRTLSRVLDGSTIHAAERLFKNCIVDSNQSISSSALVSSYHLLPVAKDVVKRWINEIQESITANKTFPTSNYTHHEFNGYNKIPNSTFIHQYHALSLLYQFRNTDKMSLIKMIQQLTERKSLNNSLAQIQMIRFVEKLIIDEPNFINNLWPLFINWLSNKSDMVELEAAKLILNNSNKFNSEQQIHAISTLQSLLSVPRTVTRFAAVRILNKVAIKDSELIGICNPELERLISDKSRSISTYAITTLLKTGNIESVDRLIQAISNFMDEISDEFKVIVIDAIRTLSLKFPLKYKSMLTFLNDVLREEGGFNFKNSIVEAIFDIIRFIPESKSIALEMLCEFIEDCEYTELSVRILHLLGNEGPKTENPSTYVRYIYNRVVLENSIVRSSAVISLSKFALINDTELNQSIKILLKRSLQDIDDEVRDRAVLSLKLLDSKDLNEAKSYLQPQFKYSLPILEQELTKYVNNPDKTSFKSSFNINSVPKMTEEEYKAFELKEKLSGKINEEIDNEEISTSKEKSENNNNNNGGLISDITKYTLKQQEYQNELSLLPEIGEYGSLLHSSAPVELTEKETEFVVTAIKHIFNDHIVIEFNIENTLDDIVLENVNVISQLDNDEYVEEFTLPIESLKPNTQGKVYISISRPDDKENDKYLLTTMNNSLSYITKDIDAEESEEGFPDEYQIEDLSLTPGDFVIPSYISNFTQSWDELPNESSAVYNLGNEENIDLQTVINKLITTMSMMPIESSEIVTSGKNHTLKLSGKSISNGKLLSVIKFAVSSKGVMMKNVVKGDENELVELVSNYLE